MACLLDANVFITAKNLHYGFDFCPALWDWILREHKNGLVGSIEKVGDEIDAVGDDLSVWAKPLGPAFFAPADASVFPSLSRVQGWVSSQGYDPAAVSGFLQVADYYLVAQALSGQHVVVTYEVPSGGKKKVKIPDVCIGLGIKCMKPFEMMRAEKARFVL